MAKLFIVIALLVHMDMPWYAWLIGAVCLLIDYAEYRAS